MAHNLSTTDGKTSMFYTGEKPWHGLGVEVAGALTAEEAIKAAGLDWAVKSEPVYDGDMKQIETHHLLRRADTRDVLHIAKTSYVPIQNRAKFKFFDDVTATGEAKYVTAGALGRGERVWILAEIAKCDLRVLQTDDVVKPYLMLADSFDGTLACWMMATSIRVVCQNTMNSALSAKYADGFRIQHRAGATSKFQDARAALGLAVKYYKGFGDVINGLASRQVNRALLDQYYATLVPDNPMAEKHSRTEAIRASMGELFESGKGNDMPGIKGSWWAAYNSVTEHVDHKRTVRGSGDDQQSKRTASILFGSGATLKKKALDLAVELAEVGA